MNDVIYICQTADITALIPKIKWNSALMILERFQNKWLEKDERENAIRFEKFNSGEDFNTSQTGRIFDSEKELFWLWNDKERFHVIYSGVKTDLPELQADDTKDLESFEQKYMLWGRRLETKPVFLELQIPRLFCYPVSCKKNKTRLALNVIEYRDKNTCQIQHYRFCGLEEI